MSSLTHLHLGFTDHGDQSTRAQELKRLVQHNEQAETITFSGHWPADAIEHILSTLRVHEVILSADVVRQLSFQRACAIRRGKTKLTCN